MTQGGRLGPSDPGSYMERGPWQPTASCQVGEIVFYAGDFRQAIEERTGGYVFIN